MFTRAFYAPTQSCHLQNIFIWLPNVENKCNCLILLHFTAILSLPILIVLFKILVLQALFSLLIFRRGCRNMFLILFCVRKQQYLCCIIRTNACGQLDVVVTQSYILLFCLDVNIRCQPTTSSTACPKESIRSQ